MSDCTCVHCDECGGSGNVWFSFNHKYLGRYRCDDLDELETCESCRGSGIEEMCDHCRELEDDAEWRMQEASEQGTIQTGLTPLQKEEVFQIVKSIISTGLTNPLCG